MRRPSFALLALALALRAAAQCAMCTSTVDLQQNGAGVGQAFNRSIGFMLLMVAGLPVAVGIVLFGKFRRAATAPAGTK